MEHDITHERNNNANSKPKPDKWRYTLGDEGMEETYVKSDRDIAREKAYQKSRREGQHIYSSQEDEGMEETYVKSDRDIAREKAYQKSRREGQHIYSSQEDEGMEETYVKSDRDIAREKAYQKSRHEGQHMYSSQENMNMTTHIEANLLSPHTIGGESRESGYTSYELTDETGSPYPLPLPARRGIQKHYVDQRRRITPLQVQAFLSDSDHGENFVRCTAQEIKERYPRVNRKSQRDQGQCDKRMMKKNVKYCKEPDVIDSYRDGLDNFDEPDCMVQTKHQENVRRGQKSLETRGKNLVYRNRDSYRDGLDNFDEPDCMVRTKHQENVQRVQRSQETTGKNLVYRYEDSGLSTKSEALIKSYYSPLAIRYPKHLANYVEDSTCNKNYTDEKDHTYRQEPCHCNSCLNAQDAMLGRSGREHVESTCRYVGVNSLKSHEQRKSEEKQTMNKSYQSAADLTDIECFASRRTSDDKGGQFDSMLHATGNNAQVSSKQKHRDRMQHFSPKQAEHFAPKLVQTEDSYGQEPSSLLRVSSLTNLQSCAPVLRSKQMTSLEKVEKWKESLSPDRYRLRARRRLHAVHKNADAEFDHERGIERTTMEDDSRYDFALENRPNSSAGKSIQRSSKHAEPTTWLVDQDEIMTNSQIEQLEKLPNRYAQQNDAEFCDDHRVYDSVGETNSQYEQLGKLQSMYVHDQQDQPAFEDPRAYGSVGKSRETFLSPSKSNLSITSVRQDSPSTALSRLRLLSPAQSRSDDKRCRDRVQHRNSPIHRSHSLGSQSVHSLQVTYDQSDCLLQNSDNQSSWSTQKLDGSNSINSNMSPSKIRAESPGNSDHIFKKPTMIPNRLFCERKDGSHAVNSQSPSPSNRVVGSRVVNSGLSRSPSPSTRNAGSRIVSNELSRSPSPSTRLSVESPQQVLKSASERHHVQTSNWSSPNKSTRICVESPQRVLKSPSQYVKTSNCLSPSQSTRICVESPQQVMKSPSRRQHAKRPSWSSPKSPLLSLSMTSEKIDGQEISFHQTREAKYQTRNSSGNQMQEGGRSNERIYMHHDNKQNFRVPSKLENRHSNYEILKDKRRYHVQYNHKSQGELRQSLLQSTPVKPSIKLCLNESISTIAAVDDQDSSDDEVLTISPE